MKNLLCKLGIHNWKFCFTTGINEYYECKRCNERKVKYETPYGYQPLNWDWLDGGDDRDIKMDGWENDTNN